MQSTTALATHLGWDVADLRECRYQPSKYKYPIFVVGDDYMTVSKVGKLPGKFEIAWVELDSWITERYGWKVFIAKMEDVR